MSVSRSSPASCSLSFLRRAVCFWLRLLLKVEPIRYADTAAITATNGFDWIGAHELRNVMPDRFLADIKFSCQIVICIVPSEA